MNRCLVAIGLNKHTYYHHQQLKEYSIRKKYADIEKAVRVILAKHPYYGCRRLIKALKKQGKVINRKTLQKLLKIAKIGLKSAKKRRRPSGIEDILNELGPKVNLVRQLSQIKFFQVIFNDFTELIYNHGKAKTNLIVYLEAMSKKALGYNLGDKSTDSTLIAYKDARNRVKKMKIDFKEVIIHQDQGSSYTSYNYIGQAVKDGFNISFSRKGHFEDNPEMESFFGRLKNEWRDEIFEIETFSELKKLVKRIIQTYNRTRIHSALDGFAPDEFIRDYLKKGSPKLFLKKG